MIQNKQQEYDKLEHVWKTATPENALNLILATKNCTNSPYKAKPHVVIVNAISREHSVKVLDFGAGVGRNTYGLIDICKEVWAFDFPNMINILKTHPKFNGSNIITSTDWDEVKKEKFTAIYAIIVLQHIYIDKVRLYLKDFTTMTDNLYVQSRNYSDSDHTSMYDILTEYWKIDDSFEYNKDKDCVKAEGNTTYFIRLYPRVN